MSSGVPLTKEKLWRVIIENQHNMLILLDEVRKAQLSAVVWRNSLVQFSLPEEYDCCDVCHESVKVFYYDEATRGNDGKVFPIMCSVCATNKAFGIENAQSGGKE